MTRMKFLSALGVVLFAVALAPARAHAQVCPCAVLGHRGPTQITVKVQLKGVPVANAQVAVTNPDGSAVASASGTTDAHGLFKLGLPAGKYVFTATASNGTGTLPYTVAASTKLVTVTLKPRPVQ